MLQDRFFELETYSEMPKRIIRYRIRTPSERILIQAKRGQNNSEAVACVIPEVRFRPENVRVKPKTRKALQLVHHFGKSLQELKIETRSWLPSKKQFLKQLKT
jgi:hypothetical protein